MKNSRKFLTLNHLVLSSGELSCLNQIAYNLTHGISRLEMKQYDRVNTKVDIRSCGWQPRAQGPKPARQKNHQVCDLCDCGNL